MSSIYEYQKQEIMMMIIIFHIISFSIPIAGRAEKGMCCQPNMLSPLRSPAVLTNLNKSHINIVHSTLSLLMLALANFRLG